MLPPTHVLTTCAAILGCALLLPAQTPQLLFDVNPGQPSSNPGSFLATGRSVVFRTNDGSSGFEPWITDGTTAGTRLLADISPGANNSPAVFAASATHFYFADDQNGLWQSDGTLLGTSLAFQATDLRGPFLALGEKLCFAADDGNNGIELWITDPFAQSATRLTDLNPGSGDSSPRGLARVGDQIYFGAVDGNGMLGLYRTDGTPGSVTPIPGLPPAPGTASPVVVGAGGRAYFLWPGSTPGAGASLWVLFGPMPLQITTLGSVPRLELVTFGSSVVFPRNDPNTGLEPWISDGSPLGTRAIADLNPGSASSFAANFAATASGIYFTAFAPGVGVEPHISDGTAAGTRLLRDLNPGAANTTLAQPFSAAGDDRVLFGRQRPGSAASELWEVVGTPGNTTVTKLADDALAPLLWFGTAYFAKFATVGGVEPHTLDLEASVHPLGVGCGTGPRTPTLSADAPRIGRVNTIRGENAAPGMPGVLLLGAPAALPIPVGAPCVLHLDLFSLVVTHAFAATPSWSCPLPLPNFQSLRGITFAAQAWFGPSTAPSGFEATNGLALTIGR